METMEKILFVNILVLDDLKSICLFALCLYLYLNHVIWINFGKKENEYYDYIYYIGECPKSFNLDKSILFKDLEKSLLKKYSKRK